MKFDEVVHSGLVFEIFPTFSENTNNTSFSTLQNDDGMVNYHSILLYISNMRYMIGSCN